MQVLNAPLLTGELGQQLKQNQHTQNSTIHERPSPVLDCTTHTNSIARSQAGQPTESLEYGGSKSRLNTRRSLRRRECQRTGPSESIQWRRRMERSSWTRHPDCRRSSLRVKKADWRKIEVAQKTFEHPQNKQYREALFILFPQSPHIIHTHTARRLVTVAVIARDAIEPCLVVVRGSAIKGVGGTQNA